MGEKLNVSILGSSYSAELFAEGLISAGCSCVLAASLHFCAHIFEMLQPSSVV